MERTARAASAAGTFGIGEEGQLPVRGEHGRASVTERESPTWVTRGVRIARNFAIAVAIMAVVPLTVVSRNGDKVWQVLSAERGVRLRAEIAEASRPLALAKDPSITPIQAGHAFNSLLPPRDQQPGFTVQDPVSRPARSWEELKLEPGMFPTAPQWGIYAGPGSNRILDAAMKPFSLAEATYLRTVATAPAWRAFDLVARAPAVDFIGGQYTSLAGVTKWQDLPIPPYKTIRAMANAGISRAAWFLSQGQRDSAETALRSIVSFGFALIDNGTTPTDQMIGNVVVATGREGLRRYFALTGDARATSPMVAAPLPRDAKRPASVESPDAIRHALIARLGDPAVPRSERIHAMRMLSLSHCTNVREMLLGPGDEVTNAIARARAELTRFPSEAAVIDLASRPLRVELRDTFNSATQMMSVSMAAVAGSAIGNAQLATCTYVATSRFIP